MTGKIHLYCGDGKGKTTAAIGLAVRAAGAGLPVLFVSFLKCGDSSEMAVLSEISGVQTLSVKKRFGFTWTLTETEKRELKKAQDQMLDQALAFAKEEKGLLVLDELVDAHNLSLVGKDLVKELLEKDLPCERVMTGRNPAPELVAAADYYTQMQAVKHPYDKGLSARKGVEY